MDLLKLKNRFWSKVQKTENCWLWKGSRQKIGYGSFFMNGKTQLAHRVAYELEIASIPENCILLHRCDNRICVRLDHLMPGTQKENVADMMNKGRALKAEGARNGNSKLDETQIMEIRKLYQKGEIGYGKLAEEFCVSKANIRDIIKAKTWRA